MTFEIGTDYTTVQARIPAYADEICSTFVPRSEAENRREFDHSRAKPAGKGKEGLDWHRSFNRFDRVPSSFPSSLFPPARTFQLPTRL